MVQILHNPRCKKSREGLEFLKEKGIDAEVIKYLDNPLTKEDVKIIVSKMNIPAENWVRKNEEIYKKEYKNKNMTEEEWIEALSKHPKLMERPVVINGGKAVIGRPIEKILEII